MALTLSIAVPSTLQFAFLWVATAFRRDASIILSGEWWRIFTALFVQDGDVGGSVFNILSLLLLGVVMETLGGPIRLLLLFFIGGIGSELIALVWQPVGAGNSVGNFSVAAGVAIACLGRTSSFPAKVGSCLIFAVGLVLLLVHDIHGAAVGIGTLVSLGMNWKTQRSCDH